MVDPSIEFTRRKLLAATGAIGVAGAGAGIGTSALFSDTETNSGNTIEAGTLDLRPNGGGSSAVDISDIAPGDSGTGTVTLNNAGSIDGFLNFDVSTITNNENGRNEPEKQVDSTSGSGELGQWLDVRYGFDTTDNGNIDVPVVDTTDRPYEPVDRTGDIEYNPNVSLPGNGSVDFILEWELPQDAGNEVQSDSVSFDLTFELLQQAAGRDVVLTGNSLYSDAKGFGGTFNPTTAEAQVGEGSWQSSSGAQSGLYFGGKFSGYHDLPTFTVDDIAEVGYWMNHSASLNTDFFLQIFTASKGDGTDLGSFFNARLTAVPPNANNGNPSWNSGQWNEFSTDSGAQNQLYFYLEDNQNVSTTPRTLQDLQGGNSFTDSGTDYGQPSDEVFAMAVITNSSKPGFDGYLDDISLELTSGETLTIDLEP